MAVDPYGINPLADAIRERDPHRFAEVAAVREPPKLFANGTADTPLFTASGIDPSLLLKLPVGMRHAAAANPSVEQVHSWFEEYAGIPEAEIAHPGLADAKLRVESWLRDTDLDTRTAEQRTADMDAEYAAFEERYFPDAIRARELRAKAEADQSEIRGLEDRLAQLRGNRS